MNFYIQGSSETLTASLSVEDNKNISGWVSDENNNNKSIEQERTVSGPCIATRIDSQHTLMPMVKKKFYNAIHDHYKTKSTKAAVVGALSGGLVVPLIIGIISAVAAPHIVLPIAVIIGLGFLAGSLLGGSIGVASTIEAKSKPIEPTQENGKTTAALFNNPQRNLEIEIDFHIHAHCSIS